MGTDALRRAGVSDMDMELYLLAMREGSSGTVPVLPTEGRTEDHLQNLYEGSTEEDDAREAWREVNHAVDEEAEQMDTPTQDWRLGVS